MNRSNHNEVVSSFQGEDVCGTHLPGQDGVGIGMRGDGSILGLEPGAGLTLPNCFLYGLVNAQPEDTSMGKQLCFSVPWWNCGVVVSSPILKEGQ